MQNVGEIEQRFFAESRGSVTFCEAEMFGDMYPWSKTVNNKKNGPTNEEHR